MKNLLLVFIGGGAGSVFRYGINHIVALFPHAFPWATFTANAVSCFLLGFLLEWGAKGFLSNDQRLLLITGFCGGFSTFSTFTAENWQLYQRGFPFLALTNLVVSIVVCMICLILGMKLAARV